MPISKEDVQDLETRFRKIEKMLDQLKRQKGLTFHILSQAIEEHRNINNKYEDDISNVRKLNN